MVMSKPWKHPTTGIYWLNRNVPEDVHPFVGKTRWKRTLETRSCSEAERRIIPHLAETNQIIEDVRAGRHRPHTDEELTALVQRWFPPLLEITTAGPGQVQDEGPPMTDRQVEQALRDRLEGEGVGIAPGSPDLTFGRWNWPSRSAGGLSTPTPSGSRSAPAIRRRCPRCWTGTLRRRA